MPNWCDNSLQLTAASKEEADELAQFLNTYQDSDTPEGQPEKTFFGFFVPEEWSDDDWYWSRVNNWGTKWDANMYDVNWLDDHTVIMSFGTAWSPPIQVYEAMVEQGWGVVASYHEPGMCFVGAWYNGEDEHYDYAECTSATVRDAVGDELDDEWGISYQMKEWEDMNDESDLEETDPVLEAESSFEEKENESNEGFGQDAYQSGVENWGTKH
jgi:hypothetical protein